MLTKKVKSRIFFLSISIVLAVLMIFIILRSLEENVVYFFSPTEIYNKESISIDKNIRVGGLVKKDSVSKNGTSINFIITDLKREIIVSYNGLLPNLFSKTFFAIAPAATLAAVSLADCLPPPL